MANPNDLSNALRDYRALRASASVEPGTARSHSTLVSRYYDAVTPFYEYAWGTSFHFAPRRRGESLSASLRRYEQDIARLLDLRPGMRVADVGCGVGGPMVTIALASGANITGININARQTATGERLLRKNGLAGNCGFLLADFLDVPLEEGYFDAAYALETLCCAEHTEDAYVELFRLMRPGGEIAAVDWCLTDCFDAGNPDHRDVRRRIEGGNATPNLLTTAAEAEAARQAGFEVLSTSDLATAGDPQTPWYRALQGRDLSFSSFARTPVGRIFTATATRLLERLRIAPAGTSEAAELLNVAADALVEGGELGIFTPAFLVHARKPA